MKKRTKEFFKKFILILFGIISILGITIFSYALNSFTHTGFRQQYTHYGIKEIIRDSIIYNNNKAVNPITTESLINEFENRDIKYYYVEIDPQKLQNLKKYLPKSGIDYKKAKMTTNIKKKIYDIEIRNKGDNHWHWLYPKKSWKIKDKKNDKIINLSNIKSSLMFDEYIAYKISEKLGALTVDSEIAGLFINDKFEGFYLEIENFDDEYLSKRDLNGYILEADDPIITNYGDAFTNLSSWSDYEEIPEDIKQKLTDLIDLLQKDEVPYNKLTELIDKNNLISTFSSYKAANVAHITNRTNNFLVYDYNIDKFKFIIRDFPIVNRFESYTVCANDVFAKIQNNKEFILDVNKLINETFTEDFFQFIEEEFDNFENKYLDLTKYDYKTSKTDENAVRTIITYDNFLEKFNEYKEITTHMKKHIDTNYTIPIYFDKNTNKLHIYNNTPRILNIKNTTSNQEINIYPNFYCVEGKDIPYGKGVILTSEETIDSKSPDSSEFNIEIKDFITNSELNYETLTEPLPIYPRQNYSQIIIE